MLENLKKIKHQNAFRLIILNSRWILLVNLSSQIKTNVERFVNMLIQIQMLKMRSTKSYEFSMAISHKRCWFSCCISLFSLNKPNSRFDKWEQQMIIVSNGAPKIWKQKWMNYTVVWNTKFVQQSHAFSALFATAGRLPRYRACCLDVPINSGRKGHAFRFPSGLR